MTSIGERIVALRKQLGLSQPELARLVGISQPSMHNIEAGKTKELRGKTLAGLCRVLNSTPDVLLGNRKGPSGESVVHEAEMLALWRLLSPADQAHILSVAKAFASHAKDALHKPKPAKAFKVHHFVTRRR